MFDQGASYSSVNAARSALSTFIPSTNKATIGSSREVCRLVKGVFEAKPALPKHTNTWSVDSVLDYMCSLPKIADLTLKQLTLRTVMLLALLTEQRGHALHLLKIGDIRMHHNKCVIVFSSKHKQTKPGAHTEPAEISAFTQNPKICLVSHLHAYLQQTEPLRKGQELLISFKKPHAPVARGTFSRWVKTMLAAAGVDTVHYGPHTTRAASCSAAANQGVSLTSILKAAGWSSEATFTRFYKKTVVDNPTFGHSVLRSFVQKQGI